MIKYEIIGGNLPAVICHLQKGQSMCTERGAMSWMTPNMQMNTNTGGGIGKMFGRMLSNESLFMNKYTCMSGEGQIAFASSFPGSIIPFELDVNSIVV